MPDAPLGFPERVALFALMTFVDDVANPDVRARHGFAIDGKVRTRLKGGGYLTDYRDNHRPGRPFVLHLEEKGYALGISPDGSTRSSSRHQRHGRAAPRERQQQAVDTVADRFRADRRLERIPSAEVGLALVEARFRPRFASVKFTPPYPTWPVLAEALTDAPGSRRGG